MSGLREREAEAEEDMGGRCKGLGEGRIRKLGREGKKGGEGRVR